MVHGQVHSTTTNRNDDKARLRACLDQAQIEIRLGIPFLAGGPYVRPGRIVAVNKTSERGT